MYQQKGFSLTEVLASLLLVTILAFTLLQQQWQSKQLINQLMLRAQGTHLLDQIEETFVAKIKKIPPISSPYHLEIQHENQEILIHLTWLKQVGSITRRRRFIGSLE